ncbi:helix-turn-helix domain-containing protein [Rouxiella badensis]|uniref:helix-turn-helix domain-containing protein n=1 Tax=Rouxiella TaxID=1565532 RepID=UPI001264BEA0|nr:MULTISPECIES: helix-turn-helix domain-containing protein [Rouxiella]KAB7893331.1 helix-turn-helix domain-containing protein [Rouxiella sp. S1S-2]MCC3705419.1 helix-turn-helix domain-containing protein [Rouxiella badensis]
MTAHAQRTGTKHASSLNTILHGRIENLISKVVEEMGTEFSLGTALQLDDSELMHQVFLHYLAGSSRADKRERMKIQRRAEGALAFYQMLDRMGGTLRASEVADLLGVSRQTVNNYVKSGKLLAVKPAKENLFPVFQFNGNQVLPHFEDILNALPENLSPVTKTSFFTSMAFFEDSSKSVIELLREGLANERQLSNILSQAKSLGKQAG